MRSRFNTLPVHLLLVALFACASAPVDLGSTEPPLCSTSRDCPSGTACYRSACDELARCTKLETNESDRCYSFEEAQTLRRESPTSLGCGCNGTMDPLSCTQPGHAPWRFLAPVFAGDPCTVPVFLQSESGERLGVSVLTYPSEFVPGERPAPLVGNFELPQTIAVEAPVGLAPVAIRVRRQSATEEYCALVKFTLIDGYLGGTVPSTPSDESACRDLDTLLSGGTLDGGAR